MSARAVPPAPLALGLALSLAACGHSPDTQANGPLRGSVQLAATAARATVVASLRSPVTTTRLGVAMFAHRAGEVVRGNLPFRLDAAPRVAGRPGSPEFEVGLTALGLTAPARGTVELLIDGDEYFPALEEEIARASRSIDFQIYIWDNDDFAVRFADRLRERARHVPTRVLLDDLGSTVSGMMKPETPAPPGFRAPVDIVRYLRRDGSPLQIRRLLNPWAVLDHCKLIIFDQQSALLGGINIGREYATEWHDLLVRLRGPIVAQLQPEFEKKWRLADPRGDLALFSPPPRPAAPIQPVPPRAFPIRILRTNLLEGRREILLATLEAIRASRERIWIENQYLVSDRVLDALLAARKRGVEVRIIIPDMPIEESMDLSNHHACRPLLRAGARIYRCPGMTHLKAMICDGWATVGAANLDTQSLQINHELNIAYSDPAAIADLEQRIFHRDFAVSRLLTLRDTFRLLGPFIEPIVDQF